MNSSPENDPSAEEVLARILRRLPLRPAPSTLEARVAGRLQRHAAAPWRRGFGHWPLLVRAAFLAVCGALIALSLLDAGWLAGMTRAVHAAGSWSTAWLRPAVATVTLAGELVEVILHVIPLNWLYGSAAAAALLYAILFGLSAMAYRSLFHGSITTGNLR